jgi:hypothetical protein
MSTIENANAELNTENELVFKLDDEMVFETALATLQLSLTPRGV